MSDKTMRTRLPPDFSISDRMVVLAKEKGWPSPASEIEAFKDYHLAHGSLMADWEAAFRTWLRNCGRFNKQQPPKPQPEPVQDFKETRHNPRVAELINGLVTKFDAKPKQ